MATDRDSVEVFRKGLQILLCVNQFDGVSASEVAEHTGINRTTAYRILETLAGENYIVKDTHDWRYRVGERAQHLSATTFDDGTQSIIVDVLEGLASCYPWSFSLTSFKNGRLIVRYETDCTSGLISRRMPNGSVLGVEDTATGRLFRYFHGMKREDEPLAIYSASVAPRAGGHLFLDPNKGVWAVSRQSVTGTYVISVPVMARANIVGSLSVRIISRVEAEAEGVKKYLEPLFHSSECISRLIRDL